MNKRQIAELTAELESVRGLLEELAGRTHVNLKLNLDGVRVRVKLERDDMLRIMTMREAELVEKLGIGEVCAPAGVALH